MSFKNLPTRLAQQEHHSAVLTIVFQNLDPFVYDPDALRAKNLTTRSHYSNLYPENNM